TGSLSARCWRAGPGRADHPIHRAAWTAPSHLGVTPRTVPDPAGGSDAWGAAIGSGRPPPSIPGPLGEGRVSTPSLEETWIGWSPSAPLLQLYSRSSSLARSPPRSTAVRFD